MSADLMERIYEEAQRLIADADDEEIEEAYEKTNFMRGVAEMIREERHARAPFSEPETAKEERKL